MAINVLDSVKVSLPGETPWVTCLRFEPKGMLLLGRIDNHLMATDLHGLKFGDVVTFHLVNYGEFFCWEPSPLRRLDFLPRLVTCRETADCPPPEEAS